MNAKQIFLAAIEQHPPHEWQPFVERECGTDAALRQRVADLLQAHIQSNPLLDGPSVFELQDSEHLLERPGMRIGPYKLLEEIGEGGFGVIFLAEQLQPMRRKVALKVLKPGLDSRHIIARFDAERQALAMMEHPNIARVHDAGLSPSGRPYFVMELINGVPINQYCDLKKLSVRSRLKLFIDVCHAVQHAHLKGIIHRDLKPSNIMVTECDGKSLVKVIDFGIAKALGPGQLTDKTLFTGMAQLIGTPAYMSPEQAALSAVDVDTRSDVYSLGTLLYEILTGATPFDGETLREAGYDEMRRIIRESDPPRPSTRITTLKLAALETVSHNRHVEPTMLRRQIQGELDWIVMKAIEKERARRYQSAAELAADISAFLRNELVSACPPSRVYLLTKLARKHRLALATSGLVLSALLMGLVLSLWQANEALRARRLADASLINEQRARADVLSREAILRRELYSGDIADAWQAWNSGEIGQAQAILNRYRPQSGQEDLREFSWHFLNTRCSYRPTVLQEHAAPILAAAISPDGRWLASTDRGGTVKIWDGQTRLEVAAWNYSSKDVTSAAFSPDSRILATAGQDATVRLWNVDDWSELACFRGHQRTVMSLSWSPEGSRLASGGRDHAIRIWNLQTKQEEQCLADQEDVVRCVVWLRDGQRLAAAVGPAVRVWRVEGWQPEGDLVVHQMGVLCLAESPNGRYLASGGYDSKVRVCDLGRNVEVMQTIARSGTWSLSFTPDSRSLLAGVASGGPSIWQVSAAEHRLIPLRVGMERSGVQRSEILDPTGETLITALEEDRQVRMSSTQEVLGYKYTCFPEDCLAVSVARDLAICGAADGTVVVRRFSTGEVLAQLSGHHAPVLGATISQTDRWLATIADDDEVILWDFDSFQLQRRLTAPPTASDAKEALVFSADECSLCAVSNTNSARIWHLQDAQQVRDVHGGAEGTVRVAFAPNRRISAATLAGVGGTIWDDTNGTVQATFGRGLKIWNLRFTPDSSQLVGAADLEGAIVWDTTSGRERFRLTKHRGLMDRVAISPDGKTLATVATDNCVRLWHLPTGRELFVLLQHTHEIRGLEFASPTKLLIRSRLDDKSPVGVFVYDSQQGPSW